MKPNKWKLPSYWDRILYKPNPDIVCKKYSWIELLISDHLPIIGNFELYVKNSEEISNADDKYGEMKKEIKIRDWDKNMQMMEDWDEENQIDLLDIEITVPEIAKSYSCPTKNYDGNRESQISEQVNYLFLNIKFSPQKVKFLWIDIQQGDQSLLLGSWINSRMIVEMMKKKN